MELKEPIIQVIDNNYLDSTFPKFPTILINRDAEIDLISKTLERFSVVLLEGEQGVGKTLCLAEFAKQNNQNSISHFITPSYSFSYHPSYLRDNLFRQLYFYVFGKEFTEDVSIDDNYFTTINIPLLRKIRRDIKPLYFIFDSLTDLSENDFDTLKSIISQLPFAKAKFIFSSNIESTIIQTLLPLNITHKIHTLTKFSFTQTKEFFNDFPAEDQQYHEIHKIGNKGLPAKLAIIKRICLEKGGISEFLESDITSETDLFALDWLKTDKENETQMLTLAIAAFDDSLLEISKIAILLKVDTELVLESINSLSFITCENDVIVYLTDSHKLFAQKKLTAYKDRVLSMLIEFYENNTDDLYKTLNLPSLYEKAKRWQDITKFLTIEAFVHLLDKFQSFAALKRQFDFGISASQKISDRIDNLSDYFRFALHKSSIKEFEKHEMWENEVEARLVLDQYDQALQIANSALLKEDKLKLLAILAKQRREKKLPEDTNLIDQIKDLYSQIDFTLIKEKGIEIAGILIYSCFDLSIEIVEKLTDNSGPRNSLDKALAQLSFQVAEAQRRGKMSTADIDLINARIKDDEIKTVATGVKFISSEYSIDEIIDHAEKIKDPVRKIMLLRGWILNNEKNLNVAKAIEYALEQIIRTSSDNAPTATALADIATPLPLIKDLIHLEKLIKLFDSQKTTINVPTRDFVKLQLIIAEALFSFDSNQAKDRILEIFYQIEDELKDLSVKTDCLALLWLKLKKIDVDKSIENSISSSTTLENQIRQNINTLFNETAFHYRMVEFIMKVIVCENPLFIHSIILDVNTLERRDAAFRNAILHYINSQEYSKIDLIIVEKFKRSIGRNEFKEHVVIELLAKFSKVENLSLSYINQLVNYKTSIENIENIENKCYAIIILLKIVQSNLSSFSELNKELLVSLEKYWSCVDLQYKKIEVGFFIAKNLSEFNHVEALKYLDNSSKLKQDELLSSQSIVRTYTLSAKICIRAFAGLIEKSDNLDIMLNQVNEIIGYMQSSGEKLKLFKEVALHLYAAKKKEKFEKVVRENMMPLLVAISDIDIAYKNSIIVSVAPILFLNNQTRFFEIVVNLPVEKKDYAIKSTCEFIITKLIDDEPTEESQIGYEIYYDEYVDICTLMSNLDSDFYIYTVMSLVVKCIKSNRGRHLSQEQKIDLHHRLNEIVSNKLPNFVTGIRHDGYRIIAAAEILSIDSYNKTKQQWKLLIDEARLVSNQSDRALVLCCIAELVDYAHLEKELLEESFKIIENISANYEKSNRFENVLEVVWKKVDKLMFGKYWELAFKSLIKDKDGNFNDIRNIIDIAYEHNPKLAESAITILDSDPARNKLKQPAEKRIAKNEKVKEMNSNFKQINTLTTQEFSSAFFHNLANLNSGKYHIRDIQETLEILKKISNLSLNESYDAICYFISNAILKNKPLLKDNGVLKGIFNATYLNAKLIITLAADNVTKMKKMYSHFNSFESMSNPMIRYGDEEKAKEYIRNWVEKNVEQELIIIDPYFTKHELEFIKVICEETPQILITILTSRLNHNNCENDNREAYIKKWNEISQSPLPEATIIIVSDSVTQKCPFHDRWWLADNLTAGFTVPSVGGIGSRDSQINEMSKDALINTQQLVTDYIYRREKRIKGYNLRYEYFELRD